MTDAEIIKALECCSMPHTEVKCYCCKSANRSICNKLNPTIILALIKRQQAVINNLKNDCSIVEVNLEEAFLKECEYEIEKAKEQTVREFAEKLKARFAKLEYKTNTHRRTCSVDYVDKTVNWTLHDVMSTEIDSLINEMFGNPEEVKCKDCKHLMYSDCYGECSQGYKGIVQPDDSCKYGERKLK